MLVGRAGPNGDLIGLIAQRRRGAPRAAHPPVHPIGPVHPYLVHHTPAPRKVGVVEPAVIDRPLLDAPCRTSPRCRDADEVSFGDLLREENHALREAEARASSLDRFAERSEARRESAGAQPAPPIEPAPLAHSEERTVVERRFEQIDVLSRGNLIDIFI